MMLLLVSITKHNEKLRVSDPNIGTLQIPLISSRNVPKRIRAIYNGIDNSSGGKGNADDLQCFLIIRPRCSFNV